MLDKTIVRQIAQEYTHEVCRVLDPKEIILFGSYVNGIPHKYSDIDIAVVFNGFNGDWYDARIDLWRISESVSLDIEPHLLDITDDRSGFTDHVLKTGNIIYREEV